jgi:hypothetical protein
MLKKILLAAAALIVLFLAYAATRPNSFRVERSADMKAAPEKVFPLINDFHNWPLWSPWEKLDPAMTRTHSGEPAGKGAAYAWKGNKAVGEGRMEILESSAPARVLIQLDFIAPFAARNTAEFTLSPAGGGTHVTWAMYGPANFMTKVMGVFCNMDKMVGKDFEAGLAAMAAAAEKK